MTLWDQIGRTRAPAMAAPARLPFHGARLAIALAVAALTYLLFPAAPAVEMPVLEVGSVAADNVIAPFAFDARKRPEELAAERAATLAAVKPTFAYSPAALDSARRHADQLFAAIGTAMQGPAASDGERLARVQQAAASSGVRLATAEAAYLVAPQRRAGLESAVRAVIGRWLATGVASSGALDPIEGPVTIRRETGPRDVPADSVPAFSGLIARARLIHPDPASAVGDAVYLKVLGAVFRPTLVQDRPQLERDRAAALRTVDANKYRLRAGEKIVGAHEVVGREEHEKMLALRDALARGAATGNMAGRLVGAVLFNMLVIALFGVTLLLFRPQVYASLRALLVIAALFATVLVAAAILAQADRLRPELIPLAMVAIVLGLLFDPRISMIAAMILAVLIGGQGVFRGTNALFINLIGGVAAAFSVRVVRHRDQVLYSILIVAGAYMLAALAIGLTLDQAWREMARSAALGALNAAISGAIAMQVLLPAAERVTGIDTYQRLLEWSDLNRPLMQRMSLEAPGTFDHTIRIANLVEAACNAIGANGLLGRVGAYYHDIGKLKKPHYFVENQPRGRNPHDKLKPSTSAAIIRNHVREGLDLAEEYRIPRSVAAFITEHHGTGQISYFLERAKERDPSSVNAAEFAYPGPLPRTPETAVCMLADGVEAASRVISDPTPTKIREVVEHIVRQRIEQGQLREAPLTLRQLEQVKQEFVRVLTGMYHNRVDYPVAAGGVSAEFAALTPTPAMGMLAVPLQDTVPLEHAGPDDPAAAASRRDEA